MGKKKRNRFFYLCRCLVHIYRHWLLIPRNMTAAFRIFEDSGGRRRGLMVSVTAAELDLTLYEVLSE